MSNPGSDATRVVLVFGAHLDDEVIGAGGLLALEHSKGSKTVVVTFSQNQTAFGGVDTEESVAQVIKAEAAAAASVLCISERVNLGSESNSIEDDPGTYLECVKLIRRYKPTVVLTHKEDDKHRDHRIVSRVVQDAVWKASQGVIGDLGAPWRTPTLLMFEVFEPISRPSNVVDITGSMQKKLDAMKAYSSQVKVIPGVLDFVEANARVRGFLIGTKYAEAYLESHILPRKSL